MRETTAGRQVVLRLIHPGEPFGVSGGWGTASYPASARALSRTFSAWHRRVIVAALRERVIVLDRAALALIAGGT